MTTRNLTMAALLFVCGQGMAATLHTDSTKCPHDTLCVDTVPVKVKPSCCADSTVEDHTTPYHKVV